MSRGKSYFLQGQQGGDVVNVSTNDSASRPEGYRLFLAIEETSCQFYDARKPDGDPLDGLGGSYLNITLPAGKTFNGQFTDVFLYSGCGIAYYD